MSSNNYVRMITLCCFIAFICYFASYMRFPVLPLFARSIGLKINEIGNVNAVFFLTAGVLSLPLGIASDQIGRKLTAGCGLLIISMSSFMIYFAETYHQLIGIFFLFGVGIAAFGPTMMSYIADFSPKSHLGRTYGWYTTALYTAMSLGPGGGGYLAQRFGLRSVFLISAIISLIGFLLLISFFPKQTREKGRAGGYTMIKKTMALFYNQPLLGTWTATLGGCFGLGMFITFMPLHCQNIQLSVSQIGLIFLAQGFFNAASRIPFGRISDRVTDRRRLVIYGIGLISITMVGLGIFSHFFHFLFFAALLGIGMAVAFTSIGALIAEMVDERSRGLAMGGYNSCIFFGMMISSGVMGDVIQHTGFEKGFLTAALVSMISAAGFFILARNYRGPKSQSL